MTLCRLLPAIALIGSLVLPALGLQVPARPTQRVNDFATILSAADRQALETILAAHEQATTNQVVIAIFPSLEGESLEDFSMRLAEAWKIGQAGKDNGVILSVFMQDRKARIEVGYGLEGALPDVVCRRILDEELTPRFRESDYAGGLRAAVGRIGAVLGDTMLAAEAPRSPAGRGGNEPMSLPAMIFIMFFLLMFVLMVWAGRRGGRRGAWSSGGRAGRGHFSGGGFSGGGGSFGGGGASGGW